MSEFANAGTITATDNSTAIVGAGTAFLNDGLSAGDLLVIIDAAGAAPVTYPIASVSSNTLLTLEFAYQGTTGGTKSYRGVRRYTEEKMGDTFRKLNENVRLLENFGGVFDFVESANPTTQGADGDTWFNYTTGDVFKKTAGSWGTAIGNLRGASTPGAIVGDGITDIVKLTQPEYDALTPDAETLYIIVE